MNMNDSLVYSYERTISEPLVGSVIDIETIGEFDQRYKDSRECSNLKQIILGYISNNKLQIFCAHNNQGIVELAGMTKTIVENLQRPTYAFNCSFESAVWFHQVGFTYIFDGELQKYRFEKKGDAIISLRISNYADPFFDDGLKCSMKWESGKLKYAIAHNRACLLKERDILLKRGYRDVAPYKLVKVGV